MKFLASFLFLYFWAFSTCVFAQDVVEIETEIGMDQLKRSEVVNKPGIKPRAVYNEAQKAKTTKTATPKPAVDDAGQVKSMAVSKDLERIEGNVVEEKAAAPSSELPPLKPIENTLTDIQVVEISGSLRKLIEENEGLKKELDQLDQQLKTVRGQQRLESNRINEIVMERDALKKQNENIIALGAKSEQSLTQLQNQLAEKENEYSLQVVRLQTELAKALQAQTPPPVTATEQLADAGSTEVPQKRGKPTKSPGTRSIAVDVASAPAADSEEVKRQGEKVLMALNSVTQEKAKLTRDEAKLHYNMGNTYFNEGDYQRAAAEYSRAVELAPEDANAHYNLAFVSGDFLNDPVSALQHYKLYLFLNPGAEDSQMVRQKMIEAEITVKADVHFNSSINKELKKKKNEFNEVTQF
ncbi:MAG: tetratricopeptide repeat protein [Candidatus Omnitrophica bacterium]|nr:tetratricopeptide repeat protein [Candidatus Omnitrophota bacterium]